MIIPSFRAVTSTALPYHKTSFLINFTAVNFTTVAKLAKRTELARVKAIKRYFELFPKTSQGY